MDAGRDVGLLLHPAAWSELEGKEAQMTGQDEHECPECGVTCDCGYDELDCGWCEDCQYVQDDDFDGLLFDEDDDDE
jgi:hypothetical protein